MIAGTKLSNYLGDVNFDGKIDIKGATEIQRFLVNIKIIINIDETNADVNCDGLLNISDVTQIQKKSGID